MPGVYVKVPVETKPHYLDLESPVFVEIFTRLVRRTAAQNPKALSVSVTEMLPVHGHQWLPDADGQRYTSELRLIGVDEPIQRAVVALGMAATDCGGIHAVAMGPA